MSIGTAIFDAQGSGFTEVGDGASRPAITAPVPHDDLALLDAYSRVVVGKMLISSGS